MGLISVLFVAFMLVGIAWGKDLPSSLAAEPTHDDSGKEYPELHQSFVVFRHGDRTPDQEELDLNPSEEHIEKSVFFPYGMKALTNKGKQRGYSVGKYLRKRYNQLVSPLYLPDEINVRTTSYARTQMTALTALAGLYPPPPAQRWNPALDWQPVTYNTPPYESDALLYWYNCPRYIWLRNDVYRKPEIVDWIKPYEDLFPYLRGYTNTNITTPEDVFFLDNLFQTLNNVGVKTPEWALDVMPKIKEMTKIEYATEFYTTEMTKLASGVLLNEILNATREYINGDKEQPKLRLYSAHENNVAALMAASKTFVPHQPNYGATFSIELWRQSNGEYGIMCVYAATAGGPGKILPIKGCSSDTMCDYEEFITLVQENAWTKAEMDKQCQKPF